MKKYLSLTIVFAMTLFSALKAEAVSVGDIYYSDKTFSTTLDSNKVPIGLVYYVDLSNQHGYIMALNQPAAMTLANAKTYCATYTTLGTSPGDWRIGDSMEGYRMSYRSWNGVNNNKFNVLNAKLATIPGYGEALIAAQQYHFERYNNYSNPVVLSTGQLLWTTNYANNTYRFRCVLKSRF